MKLAALFFSLVLWLLVGAEEPTEEWVDVRLALVMDSTVRVQDSVPHVQALVVGRARELLKLYTELPVVRRVVSADTPDEVTMEVRPEDVILPGNVSAKVSNVSPRAVHLRFLVTERRRVPVKSTVQVAADSGLHLTGAPAIQPESVEVRGPRALVRAIDAVPTEPAKILVRDTSVASTVALDTNGLGVRVVPAEVHVHVSAAHDALPPPQPALDSARGQVAPLVRRGP